MREIGEGRVIEMWVGGELEKRRRETDEIGSGQVEREAEMRELEGEGKIKRDRKLRMGHDSRWNEEIERESKTRDNEVKMRTI